MFYRNKLPRKIFEQKDTRGRGEIKKTILIICTLKILLII